MYYTASHSSGVLVISKDAVFTVKGEIRRRIRISREKTELYIGIFYSFIHDTRPNASIRRVVTRILRIMMTPKLFRTTGAITIIAQYRIVIGNRS